LDLNNICYWWRTTYLSVIYRKYRFFALQFFCYRSQ